MFFIADGSALINAIYDYEGFNAGEYGKTDKFIPANDNRKWALDVIAESLMSTIEGEEGQPSENAMVILMKVVIHKMHFSQIPTTPCTSSWSTLQAKVLAMLVLFVVLFITFEAVLLKKKDPEPWRHVFSIIYYGFGDANRYTYYAKTEKIRQVFLSKVRNQNGLTVEEFHAMSAKELVGLIQDPVLAKFAIEPGKYSLGTIGCLGQTNQGMGAKVKAMWTRKASFTFTGGIALILIGMMITNNQMMILGLTLITFIVVNSWVSGHGDIEVQRTLSADNLYKGDDLYVELLVTNRSNRRTQLLDVYDNIPHEMKLRSGLNQMRLNLRPGESARIRYVLRCPLRGHYSIGPVSLRVRNTFNLGVEDMYVDHHSDIVIFPQIKEVEEAFLRSRTPKMYTGATTLRTPGQGSEFYSLREYVPGDPFKNINWKAFARTGDLMVNEKCRDAVTDLYILLDSRDVARIGTVLKNPLEMGTVSAASLAAFFLKRRDSVALGIYGDGLAYLPPDTGDKQYFKILSSLAGVKPEGSMPLQAVTNSLSGRFSRGSPVFVISSCEGDGTVPAAVRDLVGRGHEVTVLSPSSIDFERLVSRIPRMSYEVLKLERQNRLTTLAGSGAQVIDWMPDMDLSQAIMQVRGY